MYSGRPSPPKGWSASTWALLCPSRLAIKAVSVSAQSYFLVVTGFRAAGHHGKVLTPRTQSIHMDSVRRAIPCRYSGKPHYGMLGCNIASDTRAANQAKTLAVFKIQPLSPHGSGSCLIIWAEAYLHPSMTPTTLILMSFSKTVWSKLQIGWGSLASMATPALLTILETRSVSQAIIGSDARSLQC